MTPKYRYTFILGCHKSGTSLLRSLLDGHSECFVIPAETHFFQDIGYWMRYPLRPSPLRRLSTEEKLDNIISRVRAYNRETDMEKLKYGDSNTVGWWDESALPAHLRNLTRQEGLSDGVLYEKYVEALHLALHERPLNEGKAVIEKSVENSEIAVRIKAELPSAKFVHILRNPFANIVALRKPHKSYPFLLRSLLSIYDSFYYAYQNAAALPKDAYHALRYEDLVANPKEEMQHIARFLELEYQDSMTMPTSVGRTWKGNSTSDKVFQGVSSAPVRNWENGITSLETSLVSRLFHDVLEHFGYHAPAPKGNPYVPCPSEYPHKYVLNRLLLLHLKRQDEHRRYDTRPSGAEPGRIGL